MSEVKNIRISHKDYVSGKYHTVSMRSGAGVDGVSHGDIFEAKVVLDDNGNILAESYSEKYRKEMMGKKVKEIKEVKKKEGCLKCFIRAPFRLLWWGLKQLLILASLGMLSDWLNDDSSK